MSRRRTGWLAAFLVAMILGGAVVPPPAVAPSPPSAQASIVGKLTGAGCGLIGTLGEGILGKVCKVAGKALGLLDKAQGVLSNPLVSRAASLAVIVAWVVGGAKWTLSHVAAAISQTTSPALTAAWFTTVYLRVEAIAWLLTLPFLAAAAIQAVLAGQPGLILRALGYLPLAALMTVLAVPVTMLLLAVTDSLSAGLAHVAGQDGVHFLTGTSALVVAGLTLADPFVTVIAGMVLVVCGLALWTEMIVRELAVYVVVLMLPLVFCAMAWPTRRVWATRTIEVLIALILAKFAIIVPLALVAAALSHGGAGSGVGRLIAGLALVGIGCLAPWMLMRLIPMAEVGSAAVGHIRSQLHAHAGVPTPEAAVAGKVSDRIRSAGNGTTPPGDVQEFLRNMTRRADPAEPPAARDDQPPVAPPRPDGGAHPAPDPSAAPLAQNQDMSSQPAAGHAGRHPPRPARDATAHHVQAGEEPPTMVQQADGSWQPLPTGDPTATPPPPPWEEGPATVAPEDSRATAPPADPLALAPEPSDTSEGGDGGGRR